MSRLLLPLALAVALCTDAAAQTNKKSTGSRSNDGWGDSGATAAPVSDNKNAPDAGPGAGTPPADAQSGGFVEGRNDDRRTIEGIYAAPGSPVILQNGHVGAYDGGAHARARERAAAKANRPAVAPEAAAPGSTTGSGSEGAATPAGGTGAASSGGINASGGASSGAGAAGATNSGKTSTKAAPTKAASGNGWGSPAPAKKSKTKAAPSGW
ncbi:hypothetical protein GCM10023185_40370 [Hymenobacter saemangeumensis]|uniref:Uncharacterized protein n=1 Tax=Hymenobacter saemangeumensis TaxID=1084522 RepID=A0ABP8IR09_9BACT